MKFIEDKVIQDKLTKSRYVQTGLTIISLICLYLLFSEYQNKNKTNDSEIIGYITQKTKMIQRKSDSTVVWSDVEQKTPLSRRDTIRSEELSNAVIVLNDGTELRVDENSMVILDFSDKDITINLVQGNIRAERKKTDPASTLNILSEGTKIVLTDGDLSLAKKEGEAVKLVSNRGTAIMETPNGKKYELDQNQELVKKKGNVEYSLQTQSFNLGFPEDQAFIQSDGSANVDFSWSGGEAKLEVARDSNFQNKVFSKNSAGSASTKLNNASYYWRVVGKNSSSVVRKFIVLQSETISLISPSENQSFEFLESAPLVNFSWTKSNFDASYILEVSIDSSFSNLIKQLNTRYSDINESFEKEGTYFSRVKIQYNNRDLKSRYTNTRKFQIKKSEKISNIDLYSPSEGKNFSNSDEIFFTWKQIPEAIRYEFEISKTQNFSEIITQKKTNSNFTEISLPNGKYFWRVKPIFKKAFESKFSNSLSFSVSDNKTEIGRAHV